MRQGQGKRSRGRGQGRKNVPLRAQVFDSNGPDVRIRGTAQQVHEKYMALYRDASASGERIMSENYLQHADHYYRILSAANAEAEARRNPQHPLPPQPQPAAGQTESAEAADAAADAADAAADAGEAAKGNGRDRDGEGAAGDPSDPGSGPQPDIVLAEPKPATQAESGAGEDAAAAEAPVNGAGARRGPRGGRRRGRAASSEPPSSDDGPDAEPAS